MFSEEEIREFKEDGLTDDEIEVLENGLALAETVYMLPDDIESFIREYEQKVPSGKDGGMRAVFETAQKDPEFFQKLIALDVVLAEEIEKEPIPPEKKTIITELSDEDYKKARDNYFEILANLSESDRKEFLRLISEITPEQKHDMVSRLLNQ